MSKKYCGELPISKAGFVFKKVYVRSIFSFAVPEMLSFKKQVQKPFVDKKLVDALRNGLNAEQSLAKFSQARPIFSYNTPKKNNYIDKFWAPHYNVLQQFDLSHFPFEMQLKEPFARDFSGLIEEESGDITDYSAKVKCRLYPYGAVSLHFIENFEFQSPHDGGDLVQLLNEPIKFHNRHVSLGVQFKELRDGIVTQLVKATSYNQTSNCSPQNVFVHPEIEKLPNFKTSSCWHSIATLLANDLNSRFISKYNLPSCIEASDRCRTHKEKEPTQRLFVSPYTTLLLAPHSTLSSNGLGCLRERTSNLIELATIQNEFACCYNDIYARRIKELQSYKGHPLSQLASWLRNSKGGLRQEIDDLRTIMDFQSKLPPNKWWFLWYSEMVNALNNRAGNFTLFRKSLEELKAANTELGQDVRSSIVGLLDVLKKVKDAKPF